MVFLENTTCVNSSTNVIDPVEYNLAFRGIQGISGDISKRQRDEIFNRVLQILTYNQLPSSDTAIIDSMNLLTTYVEHVSQPFILLNAGLRDLNTSFREENVRSEVPLITFANILDSGHGMKSNLKAMLALKLLAEATIK